MNKSLLEQVGLTAEQAKIYECLIKSGSLSARKLSLQTGVHRSLVYKALKQLGELDLVRESTTKGKVTKFLAEPPSALEKLVDSHVQEAQLAKRAYHEALSVLGSQFNLTCGKPGIRFYEGIEGISILNQDILHTKSDIRLIRSPMDNDTKELNDMAAKQISEQVRLGIRARVIAPMTRQVDQFLIKRDSDNLVTRCRVPQEQFKIPAQVILYGNKVAFTSFENCMITTIIEDLSIRQTMETIFEKIWEKYGS